MSNDYNGKKRSELPDSVFGIPQERKYPMPDEKHTRSAIKLFNHVDPKYEEQLAKAVIKNMKKYGIDGSVVGPNNRLRKYLPKDMIKESVTRPLIYTWERANIPEYSVIRESSHKSDFSYSGINTSTEKSEFKRNFREVFKEDPTESSVNYMQMIKYKGDLVGYVGFSRYKEGKKKYLGIGNFMILKRYQRSGMGSKVISDIIDRYKDNYNEIYCYVDKDNTNAITFYKKIAKVNTDNLTKYGYYVTLYSKSIGESAMLEGYLKSDKDIYYNKDKFDAGEINLCFITGLSGSGKSTMGRGMSSKDVEHYEMDDVICNDNFSDNNLKEYGGLIESFFKGFGKSFRLIRGDDNHNDSVFKSHKNYEKEITQAFVKHAISYCKSHKETKYVCDGIWIFMFIKPEQLKDCAVYIKGTSSIKSGYRALKRDIDEDKRNGMTSLQIFKHEFKRIKEDVLYAKENQKELKSFRTYFEKQSTNESSILPQDTGISTVIFDLGDVLVSANIKDYLIADPEVPNEIVDELLKLWFIDKDEVDDTMDLDTYREIVNKRMGVEFSKYIPKLFQYNVDCVTAFDYTIPMIQDLKDKGYKVYYLSNWSAWTYDLLQEAGKFDFLKLMDGGVFSYDTGYMKPNEEIYKTLINKYKINPEEAVFFDDREENIEAANKLGIHGIHFPRHDASIVYNNLYGRKLSKAISEYTYLSYPFNPSYNEKAVGNIVTRVLEFELGTDPMSLDMGVSLQEFTKTGAQIGKAEIEDIRTIIDSLEDDSFDDFKFKDIVYCDVKYKAKKPIAFITIRVKNINNSTVGYVSLAVDPKYQNQGIGKSLTTKAVSWFKKEKGIDFLEWHCLQDNEASKKLASDAGFREYIAKNNDEYIRYTMESSIQEYGTTGGTIVGSNQPDSVYIVNYMQNNVFSGYKEPKRAICKKGMNQMYTTNSGKAIPVDINKFKEEASDISIFRFKGTPVLSYDQIIENASTDNDFYLLLTGDSPEAYGDLEYDNRFVQEENFFDELKDITFCTESTITGQIESSNYPYMKILTESMDGRSWNFYRDINGVFAMNELTGLRTPSYENAEEIPKSQIKLIERGTVYFGD